MSFEGTFDDWPSVRKETRASSLNRSSKEMGSSLQLMDITLSFSVLSDLGVCPYFEWWGRSWCIFIFVFHQPLEKS